MTQQTLTRPRFTGWHMFAIFVAFFGVVLVVNVEMARLAVSTFSGEVVENSYDASQRFNAWLDEAKAERALGWQAAISRSGEALTVVLHDRAGKPMTGAELSGDATHPLGATTDLALRFAEVQPGVYRATLPAGRWQVRLLAHAQGRTWRHLGEVAGQ